MRLFETVEYINCKYLREQVGLTINELAAIIEADALELWELEKPSNDKFISISRQDLLILLSDYYCVPLEVIMLDDIEKDKDNYSMTLKSSL